MTEKYSHSLPCYDECRYIILKLVEQAIKDFICLENSNILSEKELYNSAQLFLFDDEYRIWWGDPYINLIEFLEILDLDINWFRKKILIAKKKKIQKFEIKKMLKNEY